ncbi:chromosome condensation protein CrcB [[Bacillus] enclensis]|uniref:Fluoride-specific ion channel FluC n=1 Tax=[Bacillus] enclensis TaxID=1402860 RepID=A0A0V8H6R8_9BACI|nr:fluoride efflux transporter CrcB [[Bacillus] enclensis]KSU58317.1 chromosome condensation protein CrcB [[Bacillus] enclensis]SCC33908.1 camphor resistance protein CrcB [[Bacillus] enclensis]
MIPYLLVGLAGSLGAMLRYWVGYAFFDDSGLFPYATLTVNLTGSFVLAFFTTGLVKKFSLPGHVKTAIGTGFVGSFTTFSTLSVETVTLFENGHILLGAVYVIVSILGGLAMSRIGFRVQIGEAAR